MRLTSIAVLCLVVAVPLAAVVRGGLATEEFRADVVVHSADGNRVLMTIDNRGESRFGAENCVFAIRAEAAFTPISMRLQNARVIVRQDSVAAVADDGRAVVFGHGALSAAAPLPGKSDVRRFIGFELVRYSGEGMLGRANASSARAAKECQAGGPGSTQCGLTGCEPDAKAGACSASCAAGYESCCHCEGGAASCGCYKP